MHKGLHGLTDRPAEAFCFYIPITQEKDIVTVPTGFLESADACYSSAKDNQIKAMKTPGHIVFLIVLNPYSVG